MANWSSVCADGNRMRPRCWSSATCDLRTRWRRRSPGVTRTRPRSRDGDGRQRLSYYQIEPPLLPEQLAQAEAITAQRCEAARALFEEPLIDSLYKSKKRAEDAFEDVYDPRFRALIDSSRAAVKQLMTHEQATN